jgi:hypothetical protein
MESSEEVEPPSSSSSLPWGDLAPTQLHSTSSSSLKLQESPSSLDSMVITSILNYPMKILELLPVDVVHSVATTVDFKHRSSIIHAHGHGLVLERRAGWWRVGGGIPRIECTRYR